MRLHERIHAMRQRRRRLPLRERLRRYRRLVESRAEGEKMIDRQHDRIIIECDSCDEVFEGGYWPLMPRPAPKGRGGLIT